ncbi:TSC22 domain family protein 2 isoform X1 [Cyrtonyx montezumae]|uniref:TSC22 domain family protein 2 isoform X1 n=1 Tax=Cyrtonyx montezumae TaxID=9017 RepID=UPI0032DAAFBD
MSKMPAKKKSCFQITSVTTAQVTSSITEDTESLDDPDESRTEDVSSEIFDVSRATDYGPEDVCERSSSEETLNNVGEAETPSSVSPNLLLDGQLAAAAGGGATVPPAVAPNGGAVPKSSAVPLPAVSAGGSGAQAALPSSGLSAPGTVAQTVAAACSSRFRVIKLDHGTGEPYRRGRWTCMDYYDRDSDSGGVLGRTGDCIRHSSTFEQAAQERDSGLGATGGSVVVSAVPASAHGPDSIADSSLTAVSQLLQTEKMNQASLQQPNFVIGQQQQSQQPIGGAMPQSTAQPMFSGASVANQQIMVPQHSQPQVNTQSVAQAGPNGKGIAPPNVTMGQPSIPVAQQQVQQASVPVTQPQQFAYSQSQIPPVHLLPTQPSGQSEYMQHMTIMQPQGAIQQASTGSVPSTAASNLPVGQVTGPSPSPGGAPVMGVPAQPGEAVTQGSGIMQSGQTQAGQTAVQQPGGVVQQGIGHAGVVQQKSVTQHQISGSSQVSGVPGAPHAVVSGVQNVPAVVPGTSVPSVSTTSVTMPNVPVTPVQSQLPSHTSVSRSTGVVQQQQHVGHSVIQGAPNVPTNLPQSNLGQFQTQAQSVVGQIDDTRRKSEPLPQPPLSLTAEIKPLVKPPVPDTLANPLQLPASTPMNSLASSVFGISIPVDGDEDRNPSTAFYQAFHFNKLRESKTFWDSASGASVVAIDNKIEQAMDLVKSHLMYAVREEVEVLKEQIKELVERNSLLERENALLKSLSNNDQLSQLPTQQANPSSTLQAVSAQPPQAAPPPQPNVSSA